MDNAIYKPVKPRSKRHLLFKKRLIDATQEPSRWHEMKAFNQYGRTQQQRNNTINILDPVDKCSN